jgi:hypothetical protein
MQRDGKCTRKGSALMQRDGKLEIFEFLNIKR